MTLTDLANHICEQCGMKEAEDTSAAKMFLQRRIEMIWNQSLWRCSLVEATMTLNTDGTSTLADTVWIPSRGTLLLPTVMDSVLAVRQDSHSMNVASLESYYRRDDDALAAQGDPTEFQVLSPAVMEWQTAQLIYLQSSLQDANITAHAIFSPNGVTRINSTVIPSGGATGTYIGTALQILGISKGNSSSAMKLQYGTYPSYVVGVNDTGLALGSIVLNPNDGNFYQLSSFLSGYSVTGSSDPLANGTYSPSGSIFRNSNGYTLSLLTYPISNGLFIGWWTINNLIGNIAFSDTMSPNTGYSSTPTLGQWSGNGIAPFPSLNQVATSLYPAPAVGVNWVVLSVQNLPASLFITIPSTAGMMLTHPRIRLTSLPTAAVNLRVLGKSACPVLGDYDEVPINNAEMCLMAFARGDMLMRQRQHGKAQLAQQEGAVLLKQLQDSESYQTANRHQIIPDGGFGDSETAGIW